MSAPHVTLVAHTHWDREWYQPFEVFRAKLCEILDDAIDLLERDPSLHFTLDGQVAMVDDFLEVRPDAEPRIRALVQAGRLHVGPWYTAADTMLTDGEALIRNLALGIRRAEELGGAMRFGYMADQFGHSAQLPQLLALFGIRSAALWRGVGPERPPHAFRWVAPDGSAVTTLWLQDGYGTGRRLPSDPEGFAQAVERSLERLAPWLGDTPLVIPVGDDHVPLVSWLPEAARALRERKPGMRVEVGGFPHHVERLGPTEHVVRGELRSPAFAPVLADVASSRIREKQAAARATSLLVRYAEPLAAWAWLAGARLDGKPIDRAWRHVLHNHAHDSAAGCGIDETHEDVKARYRWAEQLAAVARDQATRVVTVPLPEGAPAALIAYQAGGSAPSLLVEAEVPRALEGSLIAVGPDGVARPVQALGGEEERPLFEGEFAAAELGTYLGGLDPATPLFGRYLTGITIHPDGPGRLRLDVGLGEHPVDPALLAADQRRVGELLPTVDRFRVVLHASGTTRRVLVQAGPARETALLPIAIRPGTAEERERVVAVEGDAPMLRVGSLTVTAAGDGSVLIRDESLPGEAVRAHLLVDEGDRGDLYHFDRVQGAPVRPHASTTTLVEKGPLRGRLRIVSDLELPTCLSPDRSARAALRRPAVAVTDVTVVAGERRVEFVTTFHNDVSDHRLRVEARLSLRADEVDVEHGLTVVRRTLDASRLGRGIEKPSPAGQHHAFVDVCDGAQGVALMTRGLPEHEVARDGDETVLSLTLVRAVGWLARGDLAAVDQAVGPMIPTPGAQELGAHRFEYALYLHGGDWRQGNVMNEARRYVAPPIAWNPPRRLPAHVVPVAAGRPLVEVTPPEVALTAVHPAEGGGLVVRLLNASPDPVTAALRPVVPFHEAALVDPLLRAVDGILRVSRGGELLQVSLAPWQVATVLLR